MEKLLAMEVKKIKSPKILLKMYEQIPNCKKSLPEVQTSE